MANKKVNKPVPAGETGRVSGDAQGMRNFGTMPTSGPHNPNVGTSGSGMAPKPSGGAGMAGNDRPTMSGQAGLARVKGASSSKTRAPGMGGGSFNTPMNNAWANIDNTPSPVQSGSPAPAPRGGPAGVRAGGRNQNWPNGPALNQHGGPVRGRGQQFQKPKRKGLGAAFFGEY